MNLKYKYIMATGVKFVNVIPESVEQATAITKDKVRKYLFDGVYVHELVGKKHVHNGYIYLCLQGVTGGSTLGGDIAMAVVRPIKPATGEATYRLVSYTEMTLSLTDVVIFLSEGDFKVVHKDDCVEP